MKDEMLARLDQIRELVVSGDMTLLAIVAVGEQLTISIVGTAPPMPVTHGAGLALMAYIHDIVETVDEGDGIDLSTLDPDEDEAEGPQDPEKSGSEKPN